MSTHVLLALALLGPPDEFRDAPVSGISEAPWTGEQLEQMFRDQTRRTARIRDINAADVVPDLVLLHGALQGDVAIRGSELVDMRRRTEDRLERVQQQLLRDRRGLQQDLQRIRRRQSSNGLAGAGAIGVQQELANAQALIDLITETIQPGTWEIDGGRGSIRYFSPLHLLVVRNNQRVHEELGGALGVVK